MPFKDSIKKIIPTYGHLATATGLPFRRFISAIEFNLDQNPFIDCTNCKKAILKVHKYCLNCGMINSTCKST